MNRNVITGAVCVILSPLWIPVAIIQLIWIIAEANVDMLLEKWFE